jgi:hypothetical protein
MYFVSKGCLLNSAIIKQSDSNSEPVICAQSAAEKSRLTLSGRLIVSAHQPTILPYPGFFYRMYHSNIMDICPYDPLSLHSDRYQHRVKIGTDDNWKWFTLPIEACSGCSIMDAKLKTHLMSERWSELEQVYNKYPLWGEHKEALKEILLGYKYLWEVNFRFILWVRDLLDIKTYISVSYPGKGLDTTERIASQFSNYGSVIYLAGKGSAQYLDMQRYEQLTKSTLAMVTYTPPAPYSTVSILTPLLLYPREKVLEVLNIRPEPITAIVNGKEHFLKCQK